VIANRPLLEQAIVNLGENAAKHGSSRVVLAGRPVDGDVAIEVRDGGPGIPVEDRQRLFGRFVRGDTTAPGFGLGLAIVREAVDALDGELVLETNSVGTRVSIVLPGARVRTT
jgi:signal transduction histidine kinase